VHGGDRPFHHRQGTAAVDECQPDGARLVTVDQAMHSRRNGTRFAAQRGRVVRCISVESRRGEQGDIDVTHRARPLDRYVQCSEIEAGQENAIGLARRQAIHLLSTTTDEDRDVSRRSSMHGRLVTLEALASNDGSSETYRIADHRNRPVDGQCKRAERSNSADPESEDRPCVAQFVQRRSDRTGMAQRRAGDPDAEPPGRNQRLRTVGFFVARIAGLTVAVVDGSTVLRVRDDSARFVFLPA